MVKTGYVLTPKVHSSNKENLLEILDALHTAYEDNLKDLFVDSTTLEVRPTLYFDNYTSMKAALETIIAFCSSHSSYSFTIAKSTSGGS